MENPEFRSRFRSRFDELLATVFAAENLASTFSDMLRDYENLIPLEMERMNTNPAWLLEGQVRLYPRETEFTYEKRMAEILEFLEKRPVVVAKLLEKHVPADPLPQ